MPGPALRLVAASDQPVWPDALFLAPEDWSDVPDALIPVRPLGSSGPEGGARAARREAQFIKGPLAPGVGGEGGPSRASTRAAGAAGAQVQGRHLAPALGQAAGRRPAPARGGQGRALAGHRCPGASRAGPGSAPPRTAAAGAAGALGTASAERWRARGRGRCGGLTGSVPSSPMSWPGPGPSWRWKGCSRGRRAIFASYGGF